MDLLAGVIDWSYTGEVKAIIINHGEKPITFKMGDKIAQLIVERVDLSTPQRAVSLEDTKRGSQGLGSTGINTVWTKTSRTVSSGMLSHSSST